MLRNLNVFLPCYILLVFILGGFIRGFLFIFLEKLPVSIGSLIYNYGSTIIIALVLIFVWRRVGLSQTTYNQEREIQFKKGHKLVLIANLSLLLLAPAALVISSRFATVGTAKIIYAAMTLVPVLLFVAYIVGLTMIWKSKQT